MQLVARYGGRPRLDPTAYSWHYRYTDPAGVGHDVWFNDRTTLAARMQVAKDRGLGFGVWRLGQEDQGVWDAPDPRARQLAVARPQFAAASCSLGVRTSARCAVRT